MSDMMQRPMTADQRAANGAAQAVIREGLVGPSRPSSPPRRPPGSRPSGTAARPAASSSPSATSSPGSTTISSSAPDQRDKIADSLTKHWDDSWGQSIEMFMYDYQYLPPIADNLVAPFLNEAQKKIWRGTQKVQMFFGGFGSWAA